MNESDYNSTMFFLSIWLFFTKQEISEETVTEIKKRLKFRYYKKGEKIYRPEDSQEVLAFIRTGMVRGYTILNGKELTNWISIENEVFAPCNFFSEILFDESIDALEDVSIEYLTKKDYVELLNYQDFLSLSQKLFCDYYVFANRRAMIARIPNSYDRLSFFKSNYSPEVIKRCPNKYLASFLGMRPETLSRLIKNYTI